MTISFFSLLWRGFTKLAGHFIFISPELVLLLVNEFIFDMFILGTVGAWLYTFFAGEENAICEETENTFAFLKDEAYISNLNTSVLSSIIFLRSEEGR